MPYAPKIILQCGPRTANRLGPFVEKCVKDGVKLIAVMGDDCSAIEDAIDGLLVGDGTAPHFILTSAHPGESVDEVVAFLRGLVGDYAGDEQIVEI